MNKPLIDIVDGQIPSAGVCPPAEAVFIVADNPDLFLTVGSPTKQTAAYLDHRITRNPLELRTHTQRIYLHLANNNNAGVYAGLLDLFIALETKGLSLRTHLLKRCSRILDPVQKNFFQVHLESGITSTTPLAETADSLLHKGLESALPLISKIRSGSSPRHSDPLAEALDYLEYGQLEQAMQTLETALIDDPSSRTLMQELLELYKQAGLPDRYHTQSQAMIQAGHSLPNLWIAFEEQIR
ncbi:MAG TPA: hypothetical protein EYP34_03095 [Chromatiaceae bacterium]|nr:hypothetical protein [Chromatiaceae bacterium]